MIEGLALAECERAHVITVWFLFGFGVGVRTRRIVEAYPQCDRDKWREMYAPLYDPQRSGFFMGFEFEETREV